MIEKYLIWFGERVSIAVLFKNEISMFGLVSHTARFVITTQPKASGLSSFAKKLSAPAQLGAISSKVRARRLSMGHFSSGLSSFSFMS